MTSIAAQRNAKAIALRPPDSVMRLDRLGAAFQTRLSFMRSLIRRMSRERWRIERTRFDLDADGYGTVVYTAVTPERCYSLVGFSRYLDPESRTDRVIAEAWDATFALYDGVPTDAEVERLSHETPRQEAGRYLASDLVMSRANKSLRLFTYVVPRHDDVVVRPGRVLQRVDRRQRDRPILERVERLAAARAEAALRRVAVSALIAEHVGAHCHPSVNLRYASASIRCSSSPTSDISIL